MLKSGFGLMLYYHYPDYFTNFQLKTLCCNLCELWSLHLGFKDNDATYSLNSHEFEMRQCVCHAFLIVLPPTKVSQLHCYLEYLT